MKKLLLCGLKYDNNLGDSIINNCTKDLINKKLKLDSKHILIKEIDLTGKKTKTEKYIIKKNIIYYLNKFIYNSLSVISLFLNKIKLKKIKDYIDDIKWFYKDEYLIYKNQIKNIVKDVDYILFVGGGLIKYKYQNCYHYIDEITKYAEKYNKKVYFNSVGVEGFDKSNVKCRRLYKALNRQCVKSITTRDDLDTLKLYINKNIPIKQISDPAVYTKEVFNIKKNTDSNIIGIGVCRDNLFIDNGIKITSNDLFDLWLKIINELKKRNYEWKIYTNGHEGDNKFAYELAKKLGLEKKDILIPKKGEELVEIISSFKGIIATRLHSAIIAFSLDIPAVELVWNNKLKLFGKNINYPNRFIEQENFNPKHIVDTLDSALIEKYKNTSNNYKKSVEESLNNFVKEII